MGASAAGVGFDIHVHDFPCITQPSRDPAQVVAVRHGFQQSAVPGLQNMFRSGHASPGQKGGVQPAGRRVSRMKHLAAGPVSQKRPQARTLGSSHPQSGYSLILGQAQELCRCRCTAEHAASRRGVPSLFPMGGHSQGHADPGRDLVPADCRQQKFPARTAQLLPTGPGRRNDTGAAVGLGGGMHVVQLQGMSQHGVHLGRLRHRKKLVHPPDAAYPGFGPLPVGIQDRLHQTVFHRAHGHAHQIQRPENRGLPCSLRQRLPGQVMDKPRQFSQLTHRRSIPFCK